jgi:alpha-N-arabinofuranosidase
MPSIHIDPARRINRVDPRIYSGFTEHMGRCIYGGIYDPENENGLADPKTGLRKDVLEVLKGLKVPMVRYPGGNFVSSYRWQDGIGPQHLRPRRPELAWLTEESNQFGTDEFMTFCNELGAEPYICLNMGTGTMEDALAWLEYCNSSANTYYANLRRQNGHEEPYNVKYWSLGNEVWGPWQVGQMEANDYAKKAYQWAKAMKLLDPTIKLISCGETGYADWDRVVLRKLAPLVDYHSIHIYTVSEGKHEVNVNGPAAAEKAICITKSLIDLAKIEHGLDKDITVCFDEWNVWDPVRAPGEKGAEEHYDLSDALAVSSWLTTFVRNSHIVRIACIAQSVNVISPLITSPSGLFKQTTFYPLHLFSTLMRDGCSLDVWVDREEAENYYEGKTVPEWVGKLEKWEQNRDKKTGWLDIAAVFVRGENEREGEIRLSIVNRHPTQAYTIPIHVGPTYSPVNTADDKFKFKIYELWSENLTDKNWFNDDKVRTEEREGEIALGQSDGGVWRYEVKKHSFQVLVFKVKKY